MKKPLTCGGLALLAALVLSTSASAAPEARRTIYVPAGQAMLALEPPAGMCFFDQSYYAEYVLLQKLRYMVDDMNAGQLLGIFAPCDMASGFSFGASETVPVVGVVTWLNPQVGATTSKDLTAYLDTQERDYATMIEASIGGAPDPAPDYPSLKEVRATSAEASPAAAPAPAPEKTAKAKDDDTSGALPDLDAVIEEADRLMDSAGSGSAALPGGRPMGIIVPKFPTKDDPSTERFIDTTPLDGGLVRVDTLPKLPTRDDPRTYKEFDYSFLNGGFVKKVPKPEAPEPSIGDEAELAAAQQAEEIPAMPERPAAPGYAELMLPMPGEYAVERKTRRTSAGVTVGFEARIMRDQVPLRTRGIVGTTSLKHAPVQVIMNWTGKGELPSVSKVRDMMDTFLEQQVALNNK